MPLGRRMVSGHYQPHTEMVLTVPEMQIRYISCEVGVVLLSKVGEGITLPEGIVSRCREALRGAGFIYRLQTLRCILMPGQTSGRRWFIKWQNLCTRCGRDLAALPESFCSLGVMGTAHFHGNIEVPAGAVLSSVLAQTDVSLPQNTHDRVVTQ